MTDRILDYYKEHQKASKQKCDGERNVASAINSVEEKKQQITPFRAVAVGESYSDPIRVAAMLINDQPWDLVLIVGDRQGPLYDHFRTVKTPSELPTIDSFDPEKRTLVIFDECGETSSKRDRDIIENFFSRGRLRGVFTLCVECDPQRIPAWVRKVTHTLYLTSPPRSWEHLQRLFYFRAPLIGAQPNHWLKVDINNAESEVINPSQYYP